MTFDEVYTNFKNHEFIRRDIWPDCNAIKLSTSVPDEIGMFKVFKDKTYLPIDNVHAIFPICEDEDYSNIKRAIQIKDLIADDWSVFDESSAKECGFLLKHLNKATRRQLLAFSALNKLEEEFNAMSYEEKLEFKRKYPDLVKEC